MFSEILWSRAHTVVLVRRDRSIGLSVGNICVYFQPFESQGVQPRCESAAAGWVSFTSKCALTFYEKGVLLYENISLALEAENPSCIGYIMIEFYSIERERERDAWINYNCVAYDFI